MNVSIYERCIYVYLSLFLFTHVEACSTHPLHHPMPQVNVGLAADVGTLQRLPKIVGNDSVVRETLC